MARGRHSHEVLCTIITLLFLASPSTSSPCSNPTSEDFSLHDCLVALRKEAEDKNRFWFGNEYVTHCNNQSEFSAECFNPLSGFEDSLVSRIFRRRFYDRDKVKSFVNVSFKTHTGSYEACGNTYTVSDSQIVDIDPLSEDQPLSPFQLLFPPRISWTNYNTSTNSTFHILAIIDVGYVTINALYINIPDQNFTEGHTIVPYHPPLNPSQNSNPYAFLLFKQNNSFDISPDWLHKLSLRDVAQLEEFLIEFDIEGPLGMSWFTLRADPYSADNKQLPWNMNTCTHFVNKAFKKKQIPYLSTERADLSVYLDVTFESPRITFSCCCNDYLYPRTVYKPNPIGDGEVQAVLMRSDSKRYFAFQKSTAFPHRSRDFKNELHTLVMADPDVPFAIFGSTSRPYIHLLVTNIREGDFETGNAVLPYSSPWPPDPIHHTYYFLLFKQTKEFHPNFEDYAFLNCSGVFYGRCGFDMAAMIQDGDLELVGATWQLVKQTDYVRYVLKKFGVDEKELCAGVEGYTPNCGDNDNPTDTASHIIINFLIFTLCVFISVGSYAHSISWCLYQ